MSGVDILSSLQDELNHFRNAIDGLRRSLDEESDWELEIDRFSKAFIAHARAEEEVVIGRALENEHLRVPAMMALEEHELAEALLERARRSAHADQLKARLRVACNLLEVHLENNEVGFYPQLHSCFSAEEREEMGMRYREVKDRNELAPVFQMPLRETLLNGQSGRVGYIIAWLLGVPVWILLLIFLIRGH